MTGALSRWAVGEIAASRRTYSTADVIKYCQITGECWNQKNQTIIVPFLLAASQISRLLGMVLPGGGQAVEIAKGLNFHHPAFVGETVEARVEITRIDQSADQLILSISCQKQESRLILDGWVVMKVITI